MNIPNPEFVSAALNTEPSTSLIPFTVLLGLGTVFVGLICIILLISAMHAIICRFDRKKNNKASANPVGEVASTADSADEIPNREELVAAVSAALVEELGTDISAIRIHSIKKI